MLYIVVYMDSRETATLIAGLILIGLGSGVLVLEPSWISSVSGAVGALVGAGIAAIVVTLLNIRRRRSRGMVADERYYRIAEKAGHRFFQIIFSLTGFVLAAVSIIENDLPAQAVLGPIFAVMGASYVGLYYWYRRKM